MSTKFMSYRIQIASNNWIKLFVVILNFEMRFWNNLDEERYYQQIGKPNDLIKGHSGQVNQSV